VCSSTPIKRKRRWELSDRVCGDVVTDTSNRSIKPGDFTRHRTAALCVLDFLAMHVFERQRLKLVSGIISKRTCFCLLYRAKNVGQQR